MTIPIITEAGIRNDIEDALGEWLNACENGNEFNNSDCDDCDLKIEWAQTSLEMYGFSGALAIAHQELVPYLCNVDCSNTKIVLNGLSSFRGTGAKPDYNHFFYTNQNLPNKSNYNYFHFKSMIMHEIGHWLGFGDIYNNEGVCVPPPSGSDEEKTVMFGNLEGCVERDKLSDIDKCMFMLLYCCDPASDIEEPDSSNNFNTNPNPATDYITINISGINRRVNPTVDGGVFVEIYDVMGMKIQSTPLETKNFSSLQQKIDVSNLSPGVYFVKIVGSNGACSIVEKFVKY